MDVRMEKRQAFASDMKETMRAFRGPHPTARRSLASCPLFWFSYLVLRVQTQDEDCLLYLPKWRYFQEWRRRRIFPLFLHHSTCFASGCPHYLEGMRSLSLPAGNPFPAQQLRSGGGRLPSRYEHLWTDKNPAGSIVTAELELASSFIRILRSHSLPPLSLSWLFFICALPSIGGDAARGAPIGRANLSIGKACPPAGREPLAR